jgi:hypothetical protein
MEMTRKLLTLAAGIALWTAPAVFAQDINHGEVGVFGEYYRFAPPGTPAATLPTTTTASGHTNFAGVGGRLSVNVSRSWQLEGEASYDFKQVGTETFTNTTTGVATIAPSNLRVVHALFGPKLQTGGGPVRLFGTVKGGIVDFRFDSTPAGLSSFSSSLGGLRASNVNGVLYPGGGLEAYWWIFGWRTDVGDEIYFRNGAHHNLRVTFGPHIRF